jgi:hypothetical protein
MKWARQVSHRRGRNMCNILNRNPERKALLGYLSVDGTQYKGEWRTLVNTIMSLRVR